MERQERYTLEQFGCDWPSVQRFTLGLGAHGLLARSLPPNTSIQEHAATFRQLVEEKHVDIPESESESPFKVCHKKGWVHATEFGGVSRYSFPSPLHRAYVSWLLHPTDVVLPSDFSTYDLAIHVTCRFTRPQVLRCARKPGGGGPQEEALYQDEFHRGLLKWFPGGVAITPEFSSASGARVPGRIDFFIHQKRWGIECMRDGDRLEGHSGRFADDGAYEQWLTDSEMDDYILLDFRASRPIKKHPGMTCVM